MNGPTAQLAGRRIGVFGKGGAGKSTASVLLAEVLCTHGYDVCVLDADSTNVGLAQALGFREPPEELLQLFGGMVFSGGRVTCPVDDPTPLPEADVHLGTLPARFCVRRQGLTLLVAGKLATHGSGAGCDGPIIKIARDLRVRNDGQQPVTVIDFKAGFEDSARGAVTGLDFAIVVVDPSRVAIRLAVDMKNLVEGIQEGGLPATAHLTDPHLVDLANRIYKRSRIRGLFVILNKVPNHETEATMRGLLAAEDLEPIGSLPVVPTIERAWLTGSALDVHELMGEGEKLLQRLEQSAAALPAAV